VKTVIRDSGRRNEERKKEEKMENNIMHLKMKKMKKGESGFGKYQTMVDTCCYTNLSLQQVSRNQGYFTQGQCIAQG